MADSRVKRIPLLPPKEGNPRNSEGAFVKLNDGRLFFAYSHFTGGGADNSEAYIAGRYSSDGGETWTDDIMVVPNEGKENVMSVSLLRLQSGEIAFFYVVKNSWEDCRAHVRFSTDETESWSERSLCIPREGYWVLNNDRVIQLSSGRLVMPVALHPMLEGKWSGRGISTCFLSDDDGRSWRQCQSELFGPEDCGSGLQEPGVIELKDGTLMMLMRTTMGCQYRSWSYDEGVTWSPAEPTDIMSPCSPASFKRIPKTGDILLVWNDHSNIDEALQGKRTPLSVAISRDEGRTWENTKTLEDDPDGWYCYTAIEFLDDRVILGHCAGNSEIGGLNLLQITLFDVDWLYE